MSKVDSEFYEQYYRETSDAVFELVKSFPNWEDGIFDMKSDNEVITIAAKKIKLLQDLLIAARMNPDLVNMIMLDFSID